MNAFIKRLACAAAALALMANTIAFTESEDTEMATQYQPEAPEQHFVPENPNMLDHETTVKLELAAFSTPAGQSAEIRDGIIRLEGSTASKCIIPLPYQIMKGQTVKLEIFGAFSGDSDKGLDVYLTDDKLGNCSKATAAEKLNDGSGRFKWHVELISDSPANAVMLSTTTILAKFSGLTISDIQLYADTEMLKKVDPSIPYYEAVKQDWYKTMLVDSHMRLGNNKRLKKLVERANAGEALTVATIGGSITEGAGAATYQQSYAYRIWAGLKEASGMNPDSKVSFVNAGVGGTPSTFGWMRFNREITDRVIDSDGLADLVVIEYSVNDGGEPTNHRCFESMVKQILEQPNEPVVIILFAVFPSGYNLQKELRSIGDTYDLMMVSIKDGPFKQVGTKWTEKGFFFDIYHPTTLGHAVMADCVLSAITDALALPESENDINLDAAPAYGTEFMGIRTIYKHSDNSDIALANGSFSADDTGAYRNYPVGRVCGENFFHTANAGNEPLTFTAEFKNFMIAYRTMSDASYGKVEVYIDGVKVRTLTSNTGSWGQSVVDLLYDSKESATHTVSIRMADGDEAKKFTITCMGIA